MVCKITEIKEYTISLDSIFSELSFLRSEYPGFYKWYHEKVLYGLSDGTRRIYMAKSSLSFGKINGVLILKNTTVEKKICTLYIDKESRLSGFGTKLMDVAMNEFNGEKPLITVADTHIDGFRNLLKKYDFKEEDSLKDFHVDGRIEYLFNGHLYLTAIKKDVA